MFKLLNLGTVLLMGLVCQVTLAQITITSPQERIIYQRNSNNQTKIEIAGYVTSCVDRVQFRLVPLKSNPTAAALGTPIPLEGWSDLISTTTCGNFSNNVTVNGGWYRLELRSIKDESVMSTSQIEHVGVGEVFIVAGQSNATGGDANVSGPGASEDAVSSVNFQNVPIQKYTDIQLPCPEYVHLDQDTQTAPFGNYAWCWGTFGDKMVQKLGVPVMIFNAGWSSTGLWNWKESIDYQNPTPTISPFGYTFPDGLPFGHLRLTLNHYISQLGVRAILWHQGESDNIAERSKDDYYNDLKTIINESRTLSGKPDLAWLISRASRFTIDSETRIWQPVIDAQNAISGLGSPEERVSNVFPGPDTDPYFTPEYRSDEIHFSGTGLAFLAELWSDQMNEAFFEGSKPYVSNPSPNITIELTGNEVQYTAEAGWNEYSWLPANDCQNSLSSDRQWKPSPGLYRLKSMDGNRNIVYSPILYNPSSTPLPVILASFTAEVVAEKYIQLSWITTSEVNVSHFEIEKSHNAVDFERIGSIDSKSRNSSVLKYDFSDISKQFENNYYRLKIIDNDGSYSYSRKVNINFKPLIDIRIFPNPASDFITIESTNNLGEIEIYNLKGELIQRESIQAESHQLPINTLPSGLYILKSRYGSANFLKL